MKLNLLKQYAAPLFLCLFVISLTLSCKKDQLTINKETTYVQADLVAGQPSLGGWSITLRPDGTVDIVPGGDIAYRGTYKINGSTIKVKTSQNSGSFNFTIISTTEIKENQYGTRLKLVQ